MKMTLSLRQLLQICYGNLNGTSYCNLQDEWHVIKIIVNLDAPYLTKEQGVVMQSKFKLWTGFAKQSFFLNGKSCNDKMTIKSGK